MAKEELGVLYTCSCGRFIPLESLYMCVQCTKLHCGSCVKNEIECFFCPNCLLTNVTKDEAHKNRNRCSQCCQCPVCLGTLSFHASLDRQYYMMCGTCRWCSLEINLAESRADKLATHCFQQENASQEVKCANQLVEYFKAISLVEKEQADKSQGLVTSRHSMTSLRLGSKVSAAFNARSQLTSSTPLPERLAPTSCHEEDTQGGPAGCTVDVERHQRVSLTNSTKLLYPLRRQLDTRLCKRCNTCESILVMYGKSPSAYKLKQNLQAMSYIPRITLFPFSTLRVGVDCQLLLMIANPMEAIMTMTMESIQGQTTSDQVYVPNEALLLGAHNLVHHEMAALLNEENTLPEEELTFQDNPQVVKWRNHNTLCVYLAVHPTEPTPCMQVHIKVMVAKHLDETFPPQHHTLRLMLGPVLA